MKKSFKVLGLVVLMLLIVVLSAVIIPLCSILGGFAGFVFGGFLCAIPLVGMGCKIGNIVNEPLRIKK